MPEVVLARREAQALQSVEDHLEGYARLETRSAYHFGFGPRTGQMVARSIFDSAFIQQRYTGTVVLDTTSEGVVDVHGRNDLDALDLL